MKRKVSAAMLKLMLPSMLRDRNPINRLLGHAIRLQSGRIQDDEFRLAIDSFYENVDLADLICQIQLDAKKNKLDRPGGYKADVISLSDDAAHRFGWAATPLWRRRFAFLRQVGVRLDVLVLREGAQIPPHGHYGVVSGFCVLEGEVAFRHYDRVKESGESVYIRKCIDMIARPGEFATNSEYYQNIHWLCGVAPISYLFRVTVVGTQAKTFGSRQEKSERVYVDPTGSEDASGLVLAPYITHDQAASLPFYRSRAMAASA